MVKPKRSRPLVGVITDPASIYGRDILRGVLEYANLQRRWVLYEDLWQATEIFRLFPECDGAILAGCTASVLELAAGRSRHVVHCSGSAAADVLAVALDDAAAGRMAAQHLLDCQLAHFAFHPALSDAGFVRQRLASFSSELGLRGFQCHASPVQWPGGIEWMTHAHRPQLIAWLQSLPKPIGIMAADDATAHDLAGACLDAGLEVPDQVAIVGVNNDELLCEGAWPPLSSIHADYGRVGYEAAKLLDRAIGGEAVPAEERHARLQPLGVIQRQSTSILAIKDPYLAQAVRFIREHACDPCNVQDVLREVPVARRWLERQFTRQLGRTPHDEIQRVRIEASTRLLLRPELTLPDIAYRCGYPTVQNFNKTFRQRMGCTPAVHRRQALRGRP